MTVEADIAAIADGASNPASRVRTALTSVLNAGVAPYSIGDVDDVLWNSDFADFTAVNPTGSVTWTEKPGFLSAAHSGQSSGDLGALLKPVTFAIGDEWVTRIRNVGPLADYTMAGLIFTDGAVAGSKIAVVLPYLATSTSWLSTWHGTITNMSTVVLQSSAGAFIICDGVYVKLRYSAANTVQGLWSADGVSFTDLGGGDIIPAGGFTPTHVGVVVSKFGGAGVGSSSFGPLCKVA